MNKGLVVVQQYLSWKGHYRQYFENLLNSKYNNLYVSDDDEQYENGTWIKSDFDSEKPLTIKSKIQGRFVNSYAAYKALGNSHYRVLHLIEFEPLTYLILRRGFKGKKVLITIHSSDRLHFHNWISNKISGFQRWLLDLSLRHAVKNKALIITHYQCHKKSIQGIVGDKYHDQVIVVEYPAPKPDSKETKVLKISSSPKFLIYGQIREDKGIFEFLSDESTKDIDITIAGKIVDKRILEFSNRKNLRIVDKFLSSEEISHLVDSHDFMLLPYPTHYTNGAGTFKDSLAKAMPVVCSNIPIFEEIIGKYEVGVLFNHPSEILSKTSKIRPEEYERLSENCLRYALTFDWNYMRDAYFQLYDQNLAMLD